MEPMVLATSDVDESNGCHCHRYIKEDSVRKFGVRATSLFKESWATSVSTSYRTSKFSRRPAWHITMPIYLVFNLFGDLCLGSDPSFLTVDLLLLGAGISITCRLPVQSWLADVIMVAAFESAFLCSLILSDAGALYVGTTPSVNAFCAILVLHLCGVTTPAVLAGDLLSVLLTAWMCPEELSFMVFSFLLMVPWVAFVDSTAVLAHLGQAAVHRLLDDCSDGFLTINLDTGEISSISDKMEDLLSVSPDCTLPFTNFVVSDDLPRFEQTLAEARDGNFVATFLSCRRDELDAVTQFDCKLIPYFRCMNQLHLCLQMIGEERVEVAPCSGESNAEVDHTRVTVAPGNGGASDAETEITFDLASLAPPPSGMVPTLSVLSYSASYVTARNEEKRVDVATQTSSLPPLPSSLTGELPERAAPTGAKLCSRRRRKMNVRLCSSQRFLPQFAATPESYMGIQLKELFPHYNTTGSGCCKFHIIAMRYLSVIRLIASEACRPDFTPHSGWQCAMCLAMNSYEETSDGVTELVCAICCAEDSVMHGGAQTESGHDAGASAAGTPESRPSD